MNQVTTTRRSTARTRSSQLGKVRDLRRRYGREAAEALVLRSVWLPESERQLVLALFGDGKSMTDLASLMKQPVRMLRAHVRRLVERISSPLFAFVALNLEQWPATLKRVADACVIRGLTIKGAADDLHISYYTVRRHLDLLRTMLETNTPGAGMTSTQTPRAQARRARELSMCDGSAIDDEDDAPPGRREEDDPAEWEPHERCGTSAHSNSTTRSRLRDR